MVDPCIQFNNDSCTPSVAFFSALFFIENEDALIKVPIRDRTKHPFCIGEPLMATTNIIHQINPSFGDSLAIIGDGFMSLLLVAGFSKFPLDKIIVVGHHDSRLKLASKYGATKIINSKNEDAWKEIMDVTDGLGVDMSVEYAGNADSLRLAASICKAKQRAKLALASSYSINMPFMISNYLENRAPIIVPAYPNQSKNKLKDLERGIWGLEKGIFPLEELITHKYKLDSIKEAFEDNLNRSPGYIKGIILSNE